MKKKDKIKNFKSYFHKIKYKFNYHKAWDVLIAFKSLKLHDEIICRLRSFPPSSHLPWANIRTASIGRQCIPLTATIGLCLTRALVFIKEIIGRLVGQNPRKIFKKWIFSIANKLTYEIKIYKSSTNQMAQLVIH